MAWQLAGCGAMPKKSDEHISPYLCRPLRPYEEVQREPADGKTRPDRRKSPTKGAPRDPGGETGRGEQNDR